MGKKKIFIWETLENKSIYDFEAQFYTRYQKFEEYLELIKQELEELEKIINLLKKIKGVVPISLETFDSFGELVRIKLYENNICIRVREEFVDEDPVIALEKVKKKLEKEYQKQLEMLEKLKDYIKEVEIEEENEEI